MEDSNQINYDEYIRAQYKKAIDYYWKASKNNKRWYKITRMLTVIFGTFVTLFASLSSSDVFADDKCWEVFFKLVTPVLAALLTMIAGFSQNFQWGSTWQNMVLTAQNLEKERDKYIVTPEKDRKYAEEVEKLNNFVIKESEGFFERILGSIKSKKK